MNIIKNKKYVFPNNAYLIWLSFLQGIWQYVENVQKN